MNHKPALRASVAAGILLGASCGGPDPGTGTTARGLHDGHLHPLIFVHEPEVEGAGPVIRMVEEGNSLTVSGAVLSPGGLQSIQVYLNGAPLPTTVSPGGAFTATGTINTGPPPFADNDVLIVAESRVQCTTATPPGTTCGPGTRTFVVRAGTFVVPGRVVVRFHPNAAESKIASLIAAHAATVAHVTGRLASTC